MINIKRCFVAVFLFGASIIGNAQPEIAWQRCYGTSGSDYFNDIIATNDSNYIAVVEFGGMDGVMFGQDSLLYPATIMKFNYELDLEWLRNYGGTTGGSGFLRLVENNLSNYVAGGITSDVDGDFSDNHGLNDIILIELNNEGNKLWSKCYGSPGFEEFESLLATQDGGYLIAGSSYSQGDDIPIHHGDGFTNDAVLIKTNSVGSVQWVKVLGGSSYDAPIGDMIEIERGYYIVNIGSQSDDFDLSGSGISGDKRWLIKIDSASNIVDENFISGTSDFLTFGGDQIILSNDTIYIAGTGNPLSDFPGVTGYGGDYDGAVAVFDSDLNFINLKLWGGSGSDLLKRIYRDEFGSFYFLGYSTSTDGTLPGNYNNGEASDYWLMKTDMHFNLLWTKNFGGSDECGETDCSQFKGNMVFKNDLISMFIKVVVPESLPDFDIACGTLGIGNTDAWIVAFDLTTVVNEIPSDNSFSIYPNPASEILIIESDNLVPGTKILNMYDVRGSKVRSEELSDENKLTGIDIKEIHTGIYFLQIICDGVALQSQKLIID